MTNRPRLYTSLRSPYSWFAHTRLLAIQFPLHELEIIPVFPPSPQAVAAVAGGKTKGAYQRQDVERFAEAYGLQLSRPIPDDPDWWRPHAAFLWAQEQDRAKGSSFLGVAFRRRFSQGQDLGEDQVLAEIAEEAGLEPGEAVTAAEDPRWREKIQEGFHQMRADHSFGVPTFVLDDQLFFGNDRLDWFLRALATSRGEDVPDLAAEPFARVF